MVFRIYANLKTQDLIRWIKFHLPVCSLFRPFGENLNAF